MGIGFVDQSIARHREAENANEQVVAQFSQQANFFDIATTKINNDFEHECLDLAVQRLSALRLEARQGDMGPVVFGIPGIPGARFRPHQISGIWFLVNRVIGNSPPVALLADDMGLGKTYTALGALLHLKWISSEAPSGRKLSCLADRTVSELPVDDVPPFFGAERQIFERPSVVMVPANLMGQWEAAIRGLIDGTGMTFLNLNANRSSTSADLNLKPELPERGRAIHLISYTTYRSRCGSSLAGCEWGLGLFDESHHVRTYGTKIFEALMNADVHGRFQLTGTPMYSSIQSWIIQTDWLFADVGDPAWETEGPERLRDVLTTIKKAPAEQLTAVMEDAYRSLKSIAYPWLIRRWAEAKGVDGRPLVELVRHVVNEVTLEYTEDEKKRLDKFLADLKERKKGHVATFIHEYRLSCFSMDLPGNDTVLGTGNGAYEYRQTWDPESYDRGPAVRWLSEQLVPTLFGEIGRASCRERVSECV